MDDQVARPSIHSATTAQEIEEALASGENIESRNENNETPLLHSCLTGNLETTDCLVRHGADLYALDNLLMTPFIAACFQGHTHIVKRLLQQEEIDINFATDRCTALAAASALGHVDIVDILLDRKVDVNRTSKVGGITALMGVYRDKLVDVVDRLLNNGANVNAADDEGTTSLMRVAEHGADQIAERLIMFGADLNFQSKCGHTALILACFECRYGIVERLIRAGADLNIASKSGKTPLMIACSEDYEPVIKRLLDAGADTEIEGRGGRKAVDMCLPDVAERLFSKRPS